MTRKEKLYWYQVCIYRDGEKEVLNVLGKNQSEALTVLRECRVTSDLACTFSVKRMGTVETYMDNYGVDGQLDLM